MRRHQIQRLRIRRPCFRQVSKRGQRSRSLRQQVRTFGIRLHDDELFIQDRHTLVELQWIEQMPQTHERRTERTRDRPRCTEGSFRCRQIVLDALLVKTSLDQ